MCRPLDGSLAVLKGSPGKAHSDSVSMLGVGAAVGKKTVSDKWMADRMEDNEQPSCARSHSQGMAEQTG